MSTILISGGAGFIGVNSAIRFAKKGWDVVVLDNLSRRGTEDNLKWLQGQASIRFEKVDIRDHEAVERVVGATKPDALLHLAAQHGISRR